MEMQSKPGPNGTPGTFPSPSPGIAVAPSDPTRLLGIILRGLAIILTLSAAVVMAVAKQTTTAVTGVNDYNNTVDTLTVEFKATGASAYVYFIAANAIAFVFSSISFALTIINRSGSTNLPVLPIVDLVAVILLYSANGAATAITQIAKNGNDVWGKICNLASKFCDKITAAIVLSMIAALAYVLLLLFSILGLHKRSQGAS